MLSRAILKHCIIICGSHILRVSVIHFHCRLAHAGAHRIWCRRSVEQIWHYENTLKCSNNTLMFCEGSAHNKRGNSVPAHPACLNMEFIVKVFSETATLMHLCLCLLFLWSQEMRGCKGVWKWSMKKEREGSHFQCVSWYIYSQYDTLASHVSAGISRWLMHSSDDKPVKERWMCQG